MALTEKDAPSSVTPTINNCQMAFQAEAWILELDGDRLCALGKFVLERVEDHLAAAGLFPGPLASASRGLDKTLTKSEDLVHTPKFASNPRQTRPAPSLPTNLPPDSG